MQHGIHFSGNMNVVGNILFYELKLRIPHVMFDIADITRNKVIHDDHRMTFSQQKVAQM